MTTTDKGGRPYQVARTGLHVKQQKNVLQVDRGTKATQGSTYAQRHDKCNNAEKALLKNRPTWALKSYWVVQCYQDPRARHNWLAHLSYIFNCR